MNELVFLAHIAWVSLASYWSRSQSYAAMVMLMVAFSLLGNLMVFKQMLLFGLTVTTADVYTVGVILVLNFIREQFDDQHVYQAMKYSFIALALLSLAAYTQLAYQAVDGDVFQASYQVLLEKMPGLVLKSACVYWVVQYIDNKFFVWLSDVFNQNYLLARITLSLIFSQFLDTWLFSVWALEDIAYSLWDIILFSSMVKIICSLLMMSNTWLYATLSKCLGRDNV
ncbi:queuosine precursor transporter [Candidatus Comchoanobacter bicostacola]|uniref:Queuosine precursor transporter n=1 Tax=Candidatus Comchoanobacter bicostacola TaxID=2919598 RepID=A0ABY5DLV2_9GAMM|nr:queuosine precursor transporter [Candidatus Comchoanobacter bicostacola]UTC24857.1 queuosine precursor transporter [Candidatus Comchoanobacter bicostacola]